MASRAAATTFTLVLALLLALGPAAPVVGASGVSLEVSEAGVTLPAPLVGMAAATVSGFAFVFGGEACVRSTIDCDVSDQIYAYDPATDELYVSEDALPSPRLDMAAAAIGETVYLFGGHDGDVALDEVLAYEPASDRLSVLDARLPTPRSGVAAVSDGRYAYLFGGRGTFGGTLDEVLRFDPSTGEIETYVATLDDRAAERMAVWAGDAAYVMGGYSYSTFARIERFDPATGEVMVMRDRLPAPNYDAGAAYVGGQVLLFGGGGAERSTSVVAWEPGSGIAPVLLGELPIPMPDPEALVVDGRAILLGSAEPILLVDVQGETSRVADDPGLVAWFDMACSDPRGDVLLDGGARSSHAAADILAVETSLERGSVLLRVRYASAPTNAERHTVEIDIDGDGANDLMMLDDATGSWQGKPMVWNEYALTHGDTTTYVLTATRIAPQDLAGDAWTVSFGSTVLESAGFASDDIVCAKDEASKGDAPTRATPSRQASSRSTPSTAPEVQGGEDAVAPTPGPSLAMVVVAAAAIALLGRVRKPRL